MFTGNYSYTTPSANVIGTWAWMAFRLQQPWQPFLRNHITKNCPFAYNNRNWTLHLVVMNLTTLAIRRPSIASLRHNPISLFFFDAGARVLERYYSFRFILSSDLLHILTSSLYLVFLFHIFTSYPYFLSLLHFFISHLYFTSLLHIFSSYLYFTSLHHLYFPSLLHIFHIFTLYLHFVYLYFTSLLRIFHIFSSYSTSQSSSFSYEQVISAGGWDAGRWFGREGRHGNSSSLLLKLRRFVVASVSSASSNVPDEDGGQNDEKGEDNYCNDDCCPTFSR